MLLRHSQPVLRDRREYPRMRSACLPLKKQRLLFSPTQVYCRYVCDTTSRKNRELTQFFDALNELDYQAQRDSWDGTLTYLVPSRSVREDSNQPPHDGGRGRSGSSRRSHGGKYAPNIKRNGGDVENGGFASPAVADTDDGDNDGSSGNRTSKFSIFSWLRSYWGREASWYNGDDDDDVNSHSSRSGTSAQQQRRQHGQRWSAGETTTAVSRGKADGSRGKCRAANPAPYMSAALGWCCKPALRALGRRSIDTASVYTLYNYP